MAEWDVRKRIFSEAWSSHGGALHGTATVRGPGDTRAFRVAEPLLSLASRSECHGLNSSYDVRTAMLILPRNRERRCMASALAFVDRALSDLIPHCTARTHNTHWSTQHNAHQHANLLPSEPRPRHGLALSLNKRDPLHARADLGRSALDSGKCKPARHPSYRPFSCVRESSRCQQLAAAPMQKHQNCNTRCRSECLMSCLHSEGSETSLGPTGRVPAASRH